MTPLKNLMLTVAMAVVLSASTVNAEMTTFSDDTFSNSDWTTTKIRDTTAAADAISGNLQSFGGNPGTYRRGSHDWMTTVQGVSITFGHVNSTLVYNPSTQGEIIELDYSFDVDVFEAPHVNGVGFGPLLRQDGILYTKSGSTILVSGSWLGLSFEDLVSTDFVNLNGPGHPDFSTSGSPIELGYFTSNGGSGVVRSIVATFGVDNYSVNLTSNPIPEPASGTLFLLFAGLLATTRKTS